MTTPGATEPPPYDYSFVSPNEARDWRAYHDIRRIVLFDARGVPYNAHHPDEHAHGHYPKLLMHGGEPVGVVRIDIDGSVAYFRRVAIRPDVQRRQNPPSRSRATARQAPTENREPSFSPPSPSGPREACSASASQS